MLTSMLFIKHVGFKFNPVVAVDIESLYYILCLLECTRDKEETIQPSVSFLAIRDLDLFVSSYVLRFKINRGAGGAPLNYKYISPT